MLAEDYESLMLVGWRRSGTYFYKPVMYATCCPAYTIRLEAKQFILSKSQRQVVRRVDRFLDSGSVLVDPDETNKKGPDTKKLKKNDKNVKNDKNDSDKNSKINEISGDIVPPLHTLTFETSSAENTAERYELYKKYQINIHGDKPEKITKKGFQRFLVESPLRPKNVDDAINSTQNSLEICPYAYGTYHQLYRLDGRLVAVGVIDILPTGLSSVYLFYDPDEKQLNLGKYTAIKEIEFCVENKLKYYYMGFYIHSCQKMRYKGEYKPSELLCPTSLQWQPLEESMIKLNKYKFSPLCKELFNERDKIGDVYMRKSAGVWGLGLGYGLKGGGKDNTEEGKIDESSDDEASEDEEKEDDDRNKIEAVKSSPLVMFTPQFNYIPTPPVITSTSMELGVWGVTSTSSNSNTNISKNSTSSINSTGDDKNRADNIKNSTDNIKNSTDNMKNSAGDIKNSNNSDTEGYEKEKDAKRKAIRNNIDVALKLKSASRSPLDIGLGEGKKVFVNNLQPTGREFVIPLLLEWSSLCPPESIAKIVVKFG
eukprot:CAMPEP_0119052196 /NCGR_PEP_ID=MMETSP1177-20130426/73577_1 /TAXON_ID=2985 /ORGANISM="Ochromonas sp, Strain CCMP1899" /LENGTH=538 /DNA_ID=CAMNT_0007031687 /DNA_START=286 /DNA_END=1903 /DNA_ORIENTATION=-